MIIKWIAHFSFSVAFLGTTIQFHLSIIKCQTEPQRDSRLRCFWCPGSTRPAEMRHQYCSFMWNWRKKHESLIHHCVVIGSLEWHIKNHKQHTRSPFEPHHIWFCVMPDIPRWKAGLGPVLCYWLVVGATICSLENEWHSVMSVWSVESFSLFLFHSVIICLFFKWSLRVFLFITRACISDILGRNGCLQREEEAFCLCSHGFG